MRLLIKWPTRARPKLFLKTLRAYVDNLSGNGATRFLISCDADDGTMNNPAMIRELESLPGLMYRFGHSKSKIEAVNADMDLAGDFDVLLLASDDMVPVVKGYDEVIRQDMEKHFWPEYRGVLWYNEGRAGHFLNTLSILGRSLYEHFGYIYHPDYYSMWCDNEFTDVTVGLNACVYIDRIIIRHLWMQCTGDDDLHQRNTTSEIYERDRQTYLARKSAGFPRESIYAGAG